MKSVNSTVKKKAKHFLKVDKEEFHNCSLMLLKFTYTD